MNFPALCKKSTLVLFGSAESSGLSGGRVRLYALDVPASRIRPGGGFPQSRASLDLICCRLAHTRCPDQSGRDQKSLAGSCAEG